MAQGKQTPRQKMINLMYLVFIAMLALNIDAEIIRSYYESTQSLQDTRTLTESRNTDIFEKTLQAKAAAVPDTYATPLAQYKVLKGKIDALVSDVQIVKTTLKDNSDFFEKDKKTGKKINLEDNFSALNNNEAVMEYFFVDGDENTDSKGTKALKAKIDDVRNYINQTFGGNTQYKNLVDRAKQSLITTYPGSGKADNDKTWMQNKFYHQPLIAAVSNLEIIQNDARNVQSDALALMLQEKVDATIKFNMYDAVVKAPVDVQVGTPATAEVYLGSYSNSNKINIKGVSRQENGKGFLPLNTSSVGEKSFAGSIDVSMSDGSIQNFPYTHKYNVIAGPREVMYETGAMLSADKMNVLYRGLDNPISGSILGVDNKKLSLSAPGASVSGSSGKWSVRPGTGTVVNMTISGSGPKGNQSQMFTYRIKNVPPPQGQIRGKTYISVPASSIKNQIVTATIPDFDFPVTFTVTGFKLKVAGRAATYVSGNSLQSLGAYTDGLRSGDNVLILDIEATANGLSGPLKNISTVGISVL
ncbi:type IX secretion system motor protein PorM/GldM [Frigoriflavimonas asaccharolytica]|uniref:Gliding motility-associated protein GldM n=1 Tax=Frigoriflavimonas asaccharolytica TaxID=2735899 RepID=A0A8J8G6P5_9FLAO|nr:GldM family protein [Frigoriflavimonas asaccharolytica]NRS92321.1 gliding motility-associated protein GldM [Frigoriflavimonas asaccharolytica]